MWWLFQHWAVLTKDAYSEHEPRSKRSTAGEGKITRRDATRCCSKVDQLTLSFRGYMSRQR